MTLRTLVPLKDYLDSQWPEFLPPLPNINVLDQIWIEPLEVITDEAQFKLSTTVFVDEELVINMPGLSGMALVVAPSNGGTQFMLEVDVRPEFEMRLLQIPLALRFDTGLLRPMRKISQNGTPIYEPDLSRPHTDLPLGTLDISIGGSGGIDLSSRIVATISEPLQIGHLNFVLESGQIVVDLTGSAQCLLIQWTESNLGSQLNRLTPSLGLPNETDPIEITVRVILGDPISEIFLEWSGGPERTLTLPGLSATISPATRYGIVLGNDPSISTTGINRLAFILTMPNQGTVTAKSTFAWSREGERELQNDQEPPANEDPLFRFVLTNNKGDAASLVLLSINLLEFELPTFLKQLENPIPELMLPTPDQTDEEAQAFCTPIGLNTVSLRSQDDWGTDFSFALSQFQLPFLNQPESPNNENGLAQFVRIDTPGGGLTPNLDFANQTVSFPVNITLKLGSIELKSGVDFGFNWESFALEFNHDDGLKLISSEPMLPPGGAAELLGLEWTFKGAKTDDGRYHYFTLVTKNFNYQIQQAPGSTIELRYGGISSDPIVFQVSEFAITDKGLNLTTKVLDGPVRLNGLDTKFRFDGSGIVIENSQIKEFTIAGSGALPPDLVGDSRASIALQFGRNQDNNLTLISGEAKLEGNKLLHCSGTRFQFSVDALGLKFVSDGKFHLYFTITGTAVFVLADGDDAEGALALLPKIKLDLIEAPLTGDVSVIGKHIKFLVELPKPVSFNFLGCFEFELRGIGFEPQAEVFDGDGAMLISGQLKFAQGGGDIVDARIDFHNLHIGLPKPGDFLPRLYFKQLAVSLAISGAFKLNAVVDFIEEDNQKGFLGEGMVDIQGLPAMAGAFGFLRVRHDENSPWQRAWFIYLEIRKVSFVIPVVQIYLREVGLGFGYRFTLASIKAADQEGDVRKLLKELRALSRTQGDLSKRDRWAVDLEAPGQDPRWTIVLRAMIAQSSASPIITYSEASEKELPCIYLFDAVIAFRSDFTFFMAIRGWFNTNYNDFLVDDEGIRNKPLLSGFVLLSPRQKRFLAHVASNPDGKIGRHPPLPDFVKSAIEAAQFSATLLVEPGLLHYEMGWPNMLRWKGKLGPLEVEFQGGFIFRISKTELVTGTSFMARGTLSMKAGFSAGFFGVSISIFARVAYGARYIGVLAFKDITANSAFYGVVGLEIYIKITIKFWIKLLFIKKTFSFSIGLGLTAALEIAILGNLEPGIRGRGTLSLKAMGRSIRFSVKVAINGGAVDEAIERTNKFLNVGLESSDVEAIPGLDPQEPEAAQISRASAAFIRQGFEATPGVRPLADVASGKTLNAPGYTLFAIRLSMDETYFVLLPAGEQDASNGFNAEPGFLPVPPESRVLSLTGDDVTALSQIAESNVPVPATLRTNINTQLTVGPQLSAEAIARIGNRDRNLSPIEWLLQEPHNPDAPDVGRIVRVRKAGNVYTATTLADPGPNYESDFQADFRTTANAASLQLAQFDPASQSWMNRTELEAGPFSWRVNWRASILEPDGDFSNTDHMDDGEPEGGDNPQISISLAEYLRGAFIEQTDGTLCDPDAINEGQERMEDGRVYNPTDNAFESAVRGAFEQFSGSPLFKFDPNNSYDDMLKKAFSAGTSIYYDVPEQGENSQAEVQREHTDQVRGLITHDLIADLQEYVERVQALAQAQESSAEPSTLDKLQMELNAFVQTSIAFQMGLIFRVDGKRALWLDTIRSDTAQLPKIAQRLGETDEAADASSQPIRPFNIPTTSFKNNPPRFDRVVHYTNSSTVGITWDLVWDQPPAPGCTTCQAQPEHHLMNYEVRRRSLDSQERDVVLTVKSGEILHRAKGTNQIDLLRPRFQFVDNFEEQTEAELARIPERGLSYLYTITPIDFCQDRGRPLTIVATRYPDTPPQVPVNGELTVAYSVSRSDTLAEQVEEVPMPELVMPEEVMIQWAEPRRLADRVFVPIKEYQLVFRRESTLPIGSYGLDSATQREAVKALPTSNARVRPTDIIVPIDLALIDTLDDVTSLNTPAGIEDSNHDRVAIISLELLRSLGIFPADEKPKWQPEAWRIFFRTVSDGGVPSALAPVQLKLRVTSNEPAELSFTAHPEERRPAELEWLPNPIQLPLLPPQDQKATTGQAHFPMPTMDTVGIEQPAHMSWQFTPAFSNVRFQEHPAELRAIRFRWNQGPSNQPDYPLNLSAGYELLELDIDAHTNETLTGFREIPHQNGSNGSASVQIPRLLDVLRPIQNVQMLPAEDLLLTPGDTLATNQWEAWYASAQIRLENRRIQQAGKEAIDGNETPFGPWFSWRESVLVWPEWSAVRTGKRNNLNTVYHPFFNALINVLQATAEENSGEYMVDLQGVPPMQPMTFTDFRRLTSPSSDPYGWGVLQHFGLCLTFSLREEGSGKLIIGQDLLNAVDDGLAQIKEQYATLIKHLHVELLFQAGESVMLQEDQTSPKGLLGLLQLSLRPIPIQVLRYTELAVSGLAGEEVELVLYHFEHPITLIVQTGAINQSFEIDPPAPPEVEPGEDGPEFLQPTIQRITLPLNGRTKIFIRSDEVFTYEADPKAQIPIPNEDDENSPSLHLRYLLEDEPPAAPAISPYARVDAIDQRNYLLFTGALANGRQDELTSGESEISKQLEDALKVKDKAIASFGFTLPTEFEPTAESATYFLSPVDAMVETISNDIETVDPNNYAIHTRQWLRLKQYAESLNGSGRDNEALTDEPTIVVPTAKDDLSNDNLLAQVLSWTQRFMDHSSPVKSAKTLGIGPDNPLEPDRPIALQDDGPWLATAYPRAGTPAYATPDDVGRLEYFHLLEDKWAHNYRYYIRPTNRYQQLWRNLYLSTLLWSPEEEVDQARLLPALPAIADKQVAGGGLDVVLDRTKPVSMPTILRSARLDRLSMPGQPAAPGKIWEVIIAQHREQALSERNQTVYRQLSFRHVAYTLLRRFAFDEIWNRWRADSAIPYPYTFDYPVNQEAGLPQTLEPRSYDVDNPLGLTEDDEIRFALPERLDVFQQGALVVQWEALPFYYAHRMLVIAQTATQVSPVNSVIQQDFEYRAPEPADETATRIFCANFMDGTDRAAERIIQIPLRRLWDSLPPTVQEQWPDENPAIKPNEGVGRRPGILPDPEVVYQIVEFFQGNIEVQAEIYFETATESDGTEPPEVEDDEMPRPIRYAVRQLGKRQIVLEENPPVISLTDAEAYAVPITLRQEDEAGIFNWRSEALVSVELEGDPSPVLNELRLLWPGEMDAATAKSLQSELKGDERFIQALTRLVTTAQAVTPPQKPTDVVVTVESVPLGLDQLPAQGPPGTTYANLQLSGLPEGALLTIVDGPDPEQEQPAGEEPTAEIPDVEIPDAEKTHYVALEWTGILFSDQQTQLLTDLQQFFQLTEIQTALASLFSELSQATPSAPYEGDLDNSIMPPPFASRLEIVVLDDETKRLQLTGLLANAEELATLRDLPNQISTPESDFADAIEALIEEMQAATISVALNMPKRPTQDTLPDTLPDSVRDKLMLGRSLLSVNTIISQSTAQSIADGFERAVDKRAVERLYYRSLQANLTGRELQIRTRRGSAAPSARRTLDPMIIDLSTPTPVEGESA
ncbi:MAG: hypothetical protein AAF702_29035 [Chloroflexota bacterium]